MHMFPSEVAFTIHRTHSTLRWPHMPLRRIYGGYLVGRWVQTDIWRWAKCSVNYSPIYILIDHAYVHSPWFTTVSVVFMRRLTKMDGPNDYILIQHCHGERTNPHIKTKPMGFRPHIPHLSLPLLRSGPTLIWDMYHNSSNFSHKILNSYTAKFSFYWLLFLCVIYNIFELWRHKS